MKRIAEAAGIRRRARVTALGVDTRSDARSAISRLADPRRYLNTRLKYIDTGAPGEPTPAFDSR